MDYSISLNGIFAAERNFERAAGRIASANVPVSNAASDSISLTDFAAELLAVDQAKTAVQANLQVISKQDELEREALDLFA